MTASSEGQGEGREWSEGCGDSCIVGLSQFAFKFGNPITSRRRQVLPWARKREGWDIQCLATHWESFAPRLGPCSHPCAAGSTGNGGRFSESCLLIPFPPHLTLEQDLPSKPSQALGAMGLQVCRMPGALCFIPLGPVRRER